MAYDNNQEESALPTGSENSTNRKSSNLLPRYFRTPVNNKFLYSTLDQFLNPGTVEKISAFYGRKTAKAFVPDDNYVNEVSDDRQNYQLEPVVVRRDTLNNVVFYKDYIDYINQIKSLGGNVDNHNVLNAQEYYSWNPNIDWDKFVNFREYYWLTYGPDPITITGLQQQVQSTYKVTLSDNQDNYAYLLTPDGQTVNATITLYRGITYRFEINTPGLPFTIKTARTLDEDFLFAESPNGVSDQNIEQGVITFVVDQNTPDTLYYVSANDINAYGLIQIANIEENSEIDVEKEIIGKKDFTLNNGIALSNGMKVNFKGNVTPAKYAQNDWYVEGVGESIQLINEQNLAVPNDIADENLETFDDAEGFDRATYDIDDTAADVKDYIVIKKNSLDKNPWSRANKWTHKSVLQAVANYNGVSLDVDETLRAKRPIIEFDAGLKLHRFGTFAKQYVDVVDTFTTDVFSDIEGATGYNVDGVDLVDGMRILVTADTDVLVKNRIFQVNIINFGGDGDPTNKQIALTEPTDSLPLENEVVLILSGQVNQGKMFYYNGATWQEAQSKTTVNQTPLFDLCDSNGFSFSDQNQYPSSNFLGNKIFSYRVGTGTADTELGFPLSYRNVNNVGDIVYDFNLLTESFTYQTADDIVSQSTDVGYLKKYSARDTKIYVHGWTKAAQNSRQMVIRQYVGSLQSNDFAVDVYDNSGTLSDLVLRIYVDNQLLSKNNYQTISINNILYVRLNVDITDQQSVIIKTHSSATKNNNGYYETPINLEVNPLNANIINFTFGEVVDHVDSIIAQLESFEGVNPGANNLKDLGNISVYGTKFVQHSAPINLILYHLTDKQANVIKSVSFAQKEYDKFKKTFLQVAENSGFSGTTREHVDKIMYDINSDKNKNMPFYFSDMIPYGAAKKLSFRVFDDSNIYFALSQGFNMNTLSVKAVQVYLNDEQLLHGADYTFNTDNFCVISKALTVDDVVEIFEYESTLGNHVPPTPTKLGLYPKYKPEIYTDTTLLNPVDVIQGHDGSIMVAYNDYRDELLLELEKRIYNNIKISYDKDVRNIYDFVSGTNRNTGYATAAIDKSTASDFIKWNSLAGTADFTDNFFYDPNNSFTFNHSHMLSPEGKPLPGFWRAVYKQAYDTDRPHSHPWEMLGFSEQPTWWNSVYGPAPYTSDNLILWEDLEAGVIREPGKKLVYDSRYKRTDLLKHLPVDEDGVLLSPIASNYAKNLLLTLSGEKFKYGDQAPVETGWRRSSNYPFALLKSMLLNRPAHTMGVNFDASRIQKNLTNEIIYTSTQKRITLSDLIFPNNQTDEKLILTSGLINYISNYIKTDVLTNYEDYQTALKGLNQQLGFRVKGFTEKEKFKLLLDSRSPLNKSNVFVPEENYDIYLNNSSPIDVLVYSGVIVEKLPAGFAIKGYDLTSPEFKYFAPLSKQDDPVKRVGGVSKSFVTWISDKRYTSGQIVQYQNQFYQTKIDHISASKFDITKFTRLVSLPIEGGVTAVFSKNFEKTASVLNYGTVLPTQQDVVDFLLGYAKCLESKGFIFDNFNQDINTVENWSLSAQEFMFWTTQNWKAGAVLSMSPSANKLKLQTLYSIADNVFDNFYDYAVLKADGTKITRDKLSVVRQNNDFTLSVKNTSDGIYFVKIPLIQKEHAVLIDNVTVFNDVIYDQAPGYRQDRIKVIGYVVSDWNGSLNIPGFVYDEVIIKEWQPFVDYNTSDVVKFKQFFYSANSRLTGKDNFDYEEWTKLAEKPISSLKPNFEYKTNQFGDFYDLDTDNFDVEQQKLAQHLIGYQKREYLQNIINDDVAQYKFYQGFIQDKGTKNALSKLFDSLASADKDSIEFYEEWAIRTGQYGATKGFAEVEYLLDETQFKLNPQPIALTNESDPNNIDFVYRIKSDETYLKSENYTHSPLPLKNVLEEQIKTAGYVDPEDVNFVVKNYDDILNINTAELKLNQFVWVGFFKQSWQVFKYIKTDFDVLSVTEANNLITVTLNKPISLSVDDIISLTIPQSNSVQLFKVSSVSLNQITCVKNGEIESITNDGSSKGFLSKFVSHRIATVGSINSKAKDLGKFKDGELFWVEDDNATGQWITLKNNKVWQNHQQIANFNYAIGAFENDAYTLMLLHADDNNGSTTFEDDISNSNRIAKSITALGHAQIDSEQHKFGGSSARFKISKSFTVEMWIRYFSTVSGTVFDTKKIYNSGDSTEYSNGFKVYVSGGKLNVFAHAVGVSGSDIIQGTTVLSPDVWYHLAVTRDGSGPIKMFLNGAQQGNAYSLAVDLGHNNPLRIGSNFEANDGHYGWMDEIRVSNTARYTETFVLPSAPFINDANTVLLIHGAGQDSTQNNLVDDNTGTNRTAKIFTFDNNYPPLPGDSSIEIDPELSPFAESSIRFYMPSPGGYINIVDSQDFAFGPSNEDKLLVTPTLDLVFGNDNFTIEFWIKQENSSGNQILYDQRPQFDSIGHYPVIGIENGQLYYSVAGVDRIVRSIDTALIANVWYHVAVCRSDSVTKMYRNGFLIGSFIDSFNYLQGSGPHIGGCAVTPQEQDFTFDGWMDEIRISSTDRYVKNFVPNFNKKTTFGVSMAVDHSNNVMVVSDLNSAVYVYKRGYDLGQLTLRQVIDVPQGLWTGTGNFGASLDISPDGRYLVVGAPLASGVRSNYKGNYNETVSYNTDEIVKHNGQLWRVKQPIINLDPSIDFTTFDAASFWSEQEYDVDNDQYPTITQMITGNYGLGTGGADHLLIRAGKDQYEGSAVGDKLVLRWNNFTTEYPLGNDPFDGAEPLIDQTFINNEHIILEKIDEILLVPVFATVPSVGDTVSTNTADGVVDHVATSGTAVVIYLKDVSGVFDPGNVNDPLRISNVLVGTYVRAVVEDTTVYDTVSGWWKIQGAGSPDPITDRTDIKRSLVVRDIIKAGDPRTALLYANSLDTIQTQNATVLTKPTAPAQLSILSYTTDTASLLNSNNAQTVIAPFPGGAAGSNYLDTRYLVRAPKILSDVLNNNSFNEVGVWFNTINASAPSSLGLNFDDLNGTKEIIDEWDGFINVALQVDTAPGGNVVYVPQVGDIVKDTLTTSTPLTTTAAGGAAGTVTLTFAAQLFTPYIVGEQITVTGITPAGYNGTFTVTACTTTTVSYTNATTGAQTVAGTVVSFSTAEVTYTKLIGFNRVQIYVKNKTGPFSLGSEVGFSGTLQRLGGTTRTVGTILRSELGDAVVGKLFVFNKKDDAGVPQNIQPTTVSTYHTLTGTEYYLHQEIQQDGVSNAASVPSKTNRDYEQVFNIPADTGTIMPITNQGMFLVYERSALGSYELSKKFITPDLTHNSKLGTKLMMRQQNSVTTLFISTAANAVDSGKIYFIKKSSTQDWHLSVDPNYAGVFDSNTLYRTGDLVAYDYDSSVNYDKIYQSLTNQGPSEFNTVFWSAQAEGLDYLGYVPHPLNPSVPTLLGDSTENLNQLQNFGTTFDVNDSGSVLIVSVIDSLDSGLPTENKVVVYRLLSGRYQFSQTITSPEISGDNSEFATKIAISSDGMYIAVNNPSADSELFDSGVVHVYKQEMGQYILIQTLTSPQPQTTEKFGINLDFDGHTLTIASLAGDMEIDFSLDMNATYFDAGSTTFNSKILDTGSIYVYENFNGVFVYADEFAVDDKELVDFGKNLKIIRNHVYATMPSYVNDLSESNNVSPIITEGLIIDFRKNNNVSTWTAHRSPTDIVDLEKIKEIFLYNTKANTLLQRLDYVDPIQGKIAGIADQEIFYKTFYDPAIYSVGTGKLSVDDKNNWNNEQVGRLWWDLSTVKFYYPYMNDIIYSTNYWNKLFPGSSVDVYEWVESKYLPQEWNALADTREGVAAGISGITKYDNTVYTSKKIYDFIANSFSNRYYFWVKNKKTLPQIEGRKLSVYDVSQLILDPKKENYKFVSLLTSNKFALHNCKNFLENKDVAVNFKVWTIENKDINVHNEYQLISDGVSYSGPKKEIEAVWFNSLIGYDEQFRPVPDPNLSAKYRHGTLRKPRQGWFVNRIEALKQVIERVNSVLKRNLIADSRNITRLSESETPPSAISRLYDVTKDTLADLAFVSTSRTRQAILRPLVQNNKIVDVEIIDPGSGYKVVPTYTITDSTGSGAELTLNINLAGNVTSVTVNRTGENYSNNVNITVRKFSVLIQSDTEINNKWAVYQWNSDLQLWQRTLSQKYDVKQYWNYIDWYAEGYGIFTEIDHTISDSYQLQLIDNSIGDVVKIENVGSGGWILLEKIDSQFNVDYTVNYKTIGRQNGSIEFKNQLYNFAASSAGFESVGYDLSIYDNQPITETRIILETIRDNIFVDELEIEYNQLFLASLRYVFSEQSSVDWAFKTSFVKGKHNVGELSQKVLYKNDNLENYQDYIDEVKPYKTKVREYISAYESIDNSATNVTDFDLPATYNVGTKQIETSKAKVINNQIVESNLTDAYPNKHWLDHVGFKIKEIKIFSGGSGYLGIPVITITGGGGTGATAKAFVSNGRVTRIELINLGQRYLSAPTVNIQGTLDTNGVAAKAVAILGDSLVKSTHVRVKFDRTTGALLITNLIRTETFTGSGNQLKFQLKWPINLKSNKITVTVNQRKSLFSEYQYNNVQDTSKSYQRYRGLITFNEPPAVGSSIQIQYEIDSNVLQTQDRVNLLYEPTTGQLGKDLGQLIDGIDYGGVQITSIDFEAGYPGWGVEQYGNVPWDKFDTTYEDEVFLLDDSTNTFNLSQPLAAGVQYNVYRNGIRIDDLYYGLYDGSTEQPNGRFVAPENALMQTIIGDGSTQVVQIDEQVISTQSGDTILIRKSTSDGSVLPDPDIYDTLLSGGNLAYSTATGILAQDIIIDGDGFVTPTTSKGPEELVPGHILDTVDIQVYDRSGETGSKINSYNYRGNGTTTTFAIDSLPQSQDAVFVKVNNVILNNSLFSTDFPSKLLIFNTAPANNAQINIITMSVNGEKILDTDQFIGDGSTFIFVTRAQHSTNQSSYVTVNGQTLAYVLEETDSGYQLLGKTLIKFAVPPAVGSIINYVIYSSTNKSFSEVTYDDFTGDGSTAVYNLSVTPFNQEPLTHNVIVKIGNNILNAGYNERFNVTAVRSYQLKTWQQPSSTVLNTDVKAFLNGVLLTATQYTWNSTTSTINLETDVGVVGDTLKVYVISDGDYTVVGNVLTLDAAPIIGQSIKVWQFTNHDIAQIERINYDVLARDTLIVNTDNYFEYQNLTNGVIRLREPAADAQYVWVCVNGVTLSPSVDYKISNDQQFLKIKTVLQINDVVDVIHFTAAKYVGKFGFRQFKDMLNRTEYKRLGNDNKYYLTQNLNWNSQEIFLTDTTGLTVPNPIAGRPGVLFIEGERIEYFLKYSNRVGQLRRGTLGTGIKFIYDVGTEVFDQSNFQNIPYKDETIVQTAYGDGSTENIPLSWVPTSVNEFEVFVAGKRLRKNNIQSYNATLGMDSPEADVTLPPEFSVILSNFTTTAATGTGTTATLTFDPDEIIITSYNSGNAVIPAHGFYTNSNGIAFIYNSTGTAATGLVNGSTYYLRYVNENQMSIHSSYAQATNDDDSTRIKITASNGTGTQIFTDAMPFMVGQTISVTGMTPDYNGLHTVTACTDNSVSFASNVTGSQTAAGLIKGSKLLLLTAPVANTKIQLVRKVGKLWNADTSLSQTENIVANFIRAKEVSLPQ